MRGFNVRNTCLPKAYCTWAKSARVAAVAEGESNVCATSHEVVAAVLLCAAKSTASSDILIQFRESASTLHNILNRNHLMYVKRVINAVPERSNLKTIFLH